ncbi:recombinase family protein [Geoalkalibacter halelectricus]|uniref:Recombinase family protein n=1 Tax=Geoalkalibacter halelectricus TaxID=2847045 RepID=A0ABY5ZL04_9BACT|nr:recombinase family protein [Geoalkalibacter halelectricus]MDO3379465.1 recombinase family protein [Geoalkalibacter halelectricus]UWZ79524.1 recombinase family protein [Geoalkalibacter halelectricus]
MGMRIGYARVSSSGQKLDIQLDRLADCDRIYHEKASAASAKGRPELQKALDFVRDEDVFVVTKLDRLARSVVDLAGIVQKLEGKNVDLVVLDQGIDPTTMYGRLQFNILAAIGEFERELIKERSMEGRIKVIARGVKFGAKPKLTKEKIRALIRDFEAPGCSKTEIAEHYGISRSSVYRLYAENGQKDA